MLLRQLEKSVEGDETAQNFVQMVACSERGEQVLEYLSNLLNLMLEEIESQCPFMRAKAGFLWAVTCLLTHNSEYSARLLMALKPAENLFYASEFVERELLEAQRFVLAEYLLSHWESRHISTSQMVQWVRAAVDRKELFDSIDELTEQIEDKWGDNALLQRWASLVTNLVALRRGQDYDGSTETSPATPGQ